MSADSFPGISPGKAGPEDLATTTAHPARVYNYWLGGKDNFAADRAAADAAVAANPDILPGVRANRRFLRRAVRFLAAEAGIRQFLDIGTGLPATGNTHEVAQSVAPGARVVYADNDPIVLAHARALLTGTAAGSTDYVQADIRDTGAILRAAARTLDLRQPVAVLTLMMLQYVPDEDDPHAIVSRLLAAAAPGSYLVLSDTASDLRPDVTAAATARLNRHLGPVRQTRRSREQIAAFFAGLELAEPGLVPMNRWRPGPEDLALERDVTAYCGVGRKP